MPLKLTPDDLQAIRAKGRYACRLSFFSTGLQLFSDNADYIENFNQVYTHFRAEALDSPVFTCYILDRCERTQSSGLVIEDTLYSLPEGEEFIGQAEMMIFQRVIEKIDSHILLHAGVVSKDGRAYILYAPSGFGKTTLVLQLVSQGYAFMSDEYCPVNLENFRVEPFPRRVGIKNSSPFRNLLNENNSFYYEYGDKYYTDCEKMFPGSTGSSCSARCLVMLTGGTVTDSGNEPGELYDVALFEGSDNILDLISRIDGIERVELTKKDFFTTGTFRLQKKQTVMSAFYALLKKYNEDVFYVAPLLNPEAVFLQSPTIEKMSKSEAAFEIMTNMLNRAPSGKLLSKSSNSHIALLMQVGEFIKDIDCYRMTPGNLEEMSVMINSL